MFCQADAPFNWTLNDKTETIFQENWKLCNWVNDTQKLIQKEFQVTLAFI